MVETFSVQMKVASMVKKFQAFIELKVQHLVYQSPLLDHIISQMNSLYNFTPYVSKINFNIIFPSTPTLDEYC